MSINKIKKNDDVIILSGKDKGKRGTVTKVLNNRRVIVENINIAKKHVKPNPNKGEQGGIVNTEIPINISNITLYNASIGKSDNIGIKKLEDGRKVRYFKSNGGIIDI